MKRKPKQKKRLIAFDLADDRAMVTRAKKDRITVSGFVRAAVREKVAQ